jgi:acyl-homoserine-lactone acylase
MARVRWRPVIAVAMVLAACSPGEGPESIPLPTSAETTTTSTTTTTPPTTLVPPTYAATIRRTADRVPHISGATLADVAYGQGWASGEDHACTLADQVLKVLGQRSANLGPGDEGENVESDFAWRAIGIAEVAATDFEAVASRRVVDVFEAFTAGWNDHLLDVGRDELPGWCAGADWVRPLEPVEVYTYARSLTLQDSSARLVDFLGSAAPPAAGDTPPADADGQLRSALDSVDDPVPSGAAWAVGSGQAAGDGGGLLAAVPGAPWEGELRYTEVHLVVPGQLDVYGAQRLGVPGIEIGFTEGVAWSHTRSAGHRMTLYNLDLAADSTTTYLVDGEPQEMTSTRATVEILRADGSVDTETRTLWSSEYGPILDVPGIGWSTTNVITFRDANLDNDEAVEHTVRVGEVQSVDELVGLIADVQGIAISDTVAVDSDGTAWFGDTASTPQLSEAAEQRFVSDRSVNPFTQRFFDAGLVLLDGSDSVFRWQQRAGARDPGLVPFSETPRARRVDHVFNAGDSYWVPNATATLTGPYPVLAGTQRTPLSMTTRQTTAVLRATDPTGLAGDDDRFDGEELRTAVFDNAAQTAFLLRPAAVRACTANPIVQVPAQVDPFGEVQLPAGPVDLTRACRVLAEWDGTYDLDRSGAILWRETMNRFDETAFRGAGPLFDDPFDPTDPTRTPRQPAADATPLLRALARAVQTLDAAGFDPDATLGAAQFSERSDERIPIHGGTGHDGVTNVVEWTSDITSTEPVPERGEPVVPGSDLGEDGSPVNAGTSFVMTVDYTGDEVEASALLVSGQTGDRSSPSFDEQTIAFSEKRWRTVAFTDEQIEADADLVSTTVEAR